MADWKALCEELTEYLALLDEPPHELVCRAQERLAQSALKATAAQRRAEDDARAALAAEADGPAVPEGREPASVVGQPSDEELAQAAKAAIHEYKYPTELVYFLDSDSSEYEPFLLALRAAIAADRARWGHHPAPPAEGEVWELVAALRDDAECAEVEHYDLCNMTADQMRRAADLLEQCQVAPVPVASDVYFEFVVSDADCCTQAGGIAPTYAQALSEGQHYLAQYQQDGPHTLELRRVEVLPPGAFPAPDDAPLQVLPEDAQVIEPTEHTILVPARTPVPVSERPWEREGWCDEQGQCWMGDPGGGGFIPSWRLCRPEDAPNMKVSLPFNALPLPSGEVG